MRVLIVSNWFPPIRSGSSYYASNLAQSLTGRGHEVCVVTLDWGADYGPPSDLPFKVLKLPALKLPRLKLFYNLKLMGLSFTPSNFRKLREIVAEFHPDLLHHVNHIFDTTFLSTAVARSSGVPIVGSITTPIQHQNPWKQKLMELADQMSVGHFGVRKWDGIVSLDLTVHQYVGKVYGKEIQKRSAIIPFGVRLESMSLYEDDSILRSEKPQVLFVGHIHPFRNPVQLVRAMPHVLKVIPDARLILAGRIDLQEPVKATRQLGLTAEQIKFLGDTPHEEIVRLMKTSHIFASWVTGPYPSLGTAPMEAMICGTPVINDIPENLFGEGVLRNGENIVLVNSKDPHSIAEGLIRLLKDDSFWQKIGRGGRQFVLDHLSWGCIALQMEDFYKRILRQNGLKVPLENCISV